MILKTGFILIWLISIPALSQVEELKLKPFTSDGCSVFPDGTITQNKLWLACCTAHDFAYWKGGTYSDRLDADLLLRDCVAKLGKPEIALLMFAGVRAGGTPFLPSTFRWGYGWQYPRFYGPLTENELEQVEKLTKKASGSR